MLIDRTYFVGELNIPNTSQAAVGSLVDLFIEQYEEKFLNDVLGYTLYKALKAGYQESPVAQKWTDLIEGVEYTDNNNQVRFWKGLVTQPPSVINALDAINGIDVQVGRGQQYDPVTGASSVTIPEVLVGKDFIVEQRGLGKLILGVDYSVSGDTLTLLTGQFGVDDWYTYKSATLAINTSTGTNKQSPVANYVYYWYMRNNNTQTASTGETKGKHENADYASVARKLTKAWNGMTETICELVHFLNTKKEDYPEWENQSAWCVLRKFRRINEFDI